MALRSLVRLDRERWRPHRPRARPHGVVGERELATWYGRKRIAVSTAVPFRVVAANVIPAARNPTGSDRD